MTGSPNFASPRSSTFRNVAGIVEGFLQRFKFKNPLIFNSIIYYRPLKLGEKFERKYIHPRFFRYRILEIYSRRKLATPFKISILNFPRTRIWWIKGEPVIMRSFLSSRRQTREIASMPRVPFQNPPGVNDEDREEDKCKWHFWSIFSALVPDKYFYFVPRLNNFHLFVRRRIWKNKNSREERVNSVSPTFPLLSTLFLYNITINFPILQN